MTLPGRTGPLRAAVVGCGVIGRQHAEVIRATEGVELVCLVDVEPAAALALAEPVAAEPRPTRPAVSASLAEALEQHGEGIDLVSICTPSGLHADLAVQALEGGKHVIVEKPLDVDLPSARRVAQAAEAARERGQVTSVISQHRFDPASAAVARAIGAGRLGRVTSAVASVAWWRSQSYYDSGAWRGTWELDGGGAVMNQGVHTMDLLLWFLGRPIEVHAHTGLLAHERVEVEDTAVATIRFESGALAAVHFTTAAYPGLTARIQVHGDRGSAVIDNDRLVYFHAADAAPGDKGSSYGMAGAGNQALLEVGGLESSANTRGTDDLHTAHQRQYEDVIQAIRTGTAPLVGIEEAAAALAAVRAVYISAALGEAVSITDALLGRHDEAADRPI